MKNQKNSFTQDFLLVIPVFLGASLLIYILSYGALRDFSIYKQPCGKKEPLLATIKYANNYQSNYFPSPEATKFSYFYKREFSLFSIYKPLEKMELSYHNFEYYSLSKLQIEEIKKNSDWYRAEFKEMRMYEHFDESKIKE